MTTNEALRRLAVRHQIDLVRLADSVDLKFLLSLEADLLAGIERRVEGIKSRGVSSLALKQSKNLLKWVRDRIKRVPFQNNLQVGLEAIGSFEAEWQTAAFQSAIPVDVELHLNAPSDAVVTKIVTTEPLGGKLMSEYVSTWSTSLQDALVANVRLGLIQGQTVDTIVGRIQPVINTSKAGARAIVHTTVSGVTSAVRDAMYRDSADIVKGVQWVSTLDSKTSETCRGLDGRVFPLNSGPRPPAHFNCRSTTVAVTKSWRELGINLSELPVGRRPTVRNGLAGDIAANQTYEDWLKTQDVGFQKEILGDKKFQLWSKGGLTLDRFVNDETLKPLTLEELRKRESDVWRTTFNT